VMRMLNDGHSRTLASNFAYQWLQLSALDEIVPDPKVFPSADVRDDMVREVEWFVDSVFREDRSVLDLMTADYSYLNERLAVHYGIHDVKGDRFRKVQLDNPVRRGLLGKAAVLMVSSYPDRTSPVRRGAWILENITGTPPAPPPPDVEALLKDNKVGAKVFKSVRERLAEHRTKATCNACHGIMDPLGFALENFDAVGRWRNVEMFAGTRTVYTVACGDRTTLRELFQKIRDAASALDPAAARVALATLPPRAGDIRHSHADIGRARERLGYAPTHSLQQGLGESARWYHARSTRARRDIAA
jgi:hypothetical protein